MAEERPNLIELGPNLWLVKTQAGYRKAMREFLHHEGWRLEELVDQRGYGTYPAVVSFSTHYMGGSYAFSHAMWQRAEDYVRDLRARLETIEGAL